MKYLSFVEFCRKLIVVFGYELNEIFVVTLSLSFVLYTCLVFDKLRVGNVAFVSVQYVYMMFALLSGRRFSYPRSRGSCQGMLGMQGIGVAQFEQ